MNLFRAVLLLFAVVPAVVPQQKEQTLIRTPVTLPPVAVQRPAVQDTIRVLALMVQFRPDADARTSGDGTFLTTGSPRQIDPPPHNAAYFAGKLQFLENYFRKSSNGKLVVRGDVFGSVVNLADSMGAYSPPRDGPNTVLAQLVVESWTAADAINPSFPFSQYDAFIIFHAGVGRDIDLISLFGFDPTPHDIPSVTLSLSAMKELLENPGFQGVPVNNGSFFITNSMILPETETRVFVSGSRSDTLQLGINGLLAASFGSFLGLPDLFDTRTGRSGIGQFGLMDGAAIFAYNGLFPPEPSAWEKIFLGWTEPLVVPPGTTNLVIPAVGLTTTGSDTIYKIPVTEREYFLVENRSRDPLGDGQKLTLIQNGSFVTKHFGRDTTGFYFNDVREITGSLIDVEDFDWAISGDMTLEGFEGGGVLIWHIDEDRIGTGLLSNTVNADPLRRGVDLEEADGSQDIGVAYEFLQPGSGTQNGWPPDAWFAGNPAPVYRNAFDAASAPSSRSNAGANSFIAIRNFGPKSPRAIVTVDRGVSGFRAGALTRSFGPSAVLSAPTVSSNAVFVPVDGGVSVFRPDGFSAVPDTSGLLSAIGGHFPLAVLDSAVLVAAGVQDTAVMIWKLIDNTSDGVFDSISAQAVVLSARVTTPPMIVDSAGVPLVLVGDAAGNVSKISLDGNLRSVTALPQNPVRRLATTGFGDGSFFATAGSSLFAGQNEIPLGAPGPWLIAAGRSASETFAAVAQEGGNIVTAFTANGTRKFSLSVTDTISEILVADLNGDGRPDILIAAQSRLSAVNEHGVTIDHYPKRLSDGNQFTGTPLVVDVDGDGSVDVLAQTSEGTMMAFRSDGRMAESFPFQSAPSGPGDPVVFPSTTGPAGILVAGTSGSLQAWEASAISVPSAISWSGFLGDARHTNFFDGSGLPQTPVSTQFLPRDRVYNWPNPVYGSTTMIRYFTSEPASIAVRIFDIAGMTVTDLKGEAAGGVDGELVWDVTNIQSGIYLARVEATSAGRSESVVIKIAVVK